MPTRPDQVRKPQPKHRAPSSRRAPRTVLRSSLTLSAMAVVGTGLAVSGGALGGLGSEGDLAPAAGDLAAADAGATTGQTTGGTTSDDTTADDTAASATRAPLVTRSDRREEADPAKADLLAVGGADTANAMTRTEDLSDEDPRTIARALLAEFGFSESQFGCLDSLWTRESNWRVNADNPTSSAYGIPQALPGSKMSSAGADWATNPVTQIRWGLGYIQDRYGSPCGAWAHSEARGFY